MNNNYKSIGDIGQNCVIGHFARYGIGIAIPISDNYPFDFVAILNNKLFKVQVKSSSRCKSGAISFDLQTNNFYDGDTRGYTNQDCDILACYDLVHDKVYLLRPEDFTERSGINIRFELPLNNQKGDINWDKDFVISKERIEKVFGCIPPDLSIIFAKKESAQYKNICSICGSEFVNGYKHGKYCSSKCRKVYRETERRFNPTREELEKMVSATPMTQVGKHFGVSDNAVRKRCKLLGINCPKFGPGYWAKLKAGKIQVSLSLK